MTSWQPVVTLALRHSSLICVPASQTGRAVSAWCWLFSTQAAVTYSLLVSLLCY
jgi:hypothetical protein